MDTVIKVSVVNVITIGLIAVIFTMGAHWALNAAGMGRAPAQAQ